MSIVEKEKEVFIRVMATPGSGERLWFLVETGEKRPAHFPEFVIVRQGMAGTVRQAAGLLARYHFFGEFWHRGDLGDNAAGAVSLHHVGSGCFVAKLRLPAPDGPVQQEAA